MNASESAPLCDGCGNVVRDIGCAACSGRALVCKRDVKQGAASDLKPNANNTGNSLSSSILRRSLLRGQNEQVPCTECMAGGWELLFKRCILCSACGECE